MTNDEMFYLGELGELIKFLDINAFLLLTKYGVLWG